MDDYPNDYLTTMSDAELLKNLDEVVGRAAAYQADLEDIVHEMKQRVLPAAPPKKTSTWLELDAMLRAANVQPAVTVEPESDSLAELWEESVVYSRLMFGKSVHKDDPALQRLVAKGVFEIADSQEEAASRLEELRQKAMDKSFEQYSRQLDKLIGDALVTTPPMPEKTEWSDEALEGLLRAVKEQNDADRCAADCWCKPKDNVLNLDDYRTDDEEAEVAFANIKTGYLSKPKGIVVTAPSYEHWTDVVWRFGLNLEDTYSHLEFSDDEVHVTYHYGFTSATGITYVFDLTYNITGGPN